MFKLIHCTPRSELYHRAYLRKLNSLMESDESYAGSELMSVVFLGVKAVITSRGTDDPKNIQALNYKFQELELIKALMAFMTPRQFLTTFPVIKEYDGARYQLKDYFSTLEMVRTMDLDEPIGEEIDDFLWDYRNRDTELFQLEVFGVISDLARAKGIPTPMEKFAAKNSIPLYFEDKKNKELIGPILIKQVDDGYYYEDSKAQTVQFKKSLPDYIRVVK